MVLPQRARTPLPRPGVGQGREEQLVALAQERSSSEQPEAAGGGFGSMREASVHFLLLEGHGSRGWWDARWVRERPCAHGYSMSLRYGAISCMRLGLHSVSVAVGACVWGSEWVMGARVRVRGGDIFHLFYTVFKI